MKHALGIIALNRFEYQQRKQQKQYDTQFNRLNIVQGDDGFLFIDQEKIIALDDGDIIHTPSFSFLLTLESWTGQKQTKAARSEQLKPSLFNHTQKSGRRPCY